jgi:hypothetical protein
MTHLPKLSDTQRAALQQEEEAPMSPADFVARCNAPWTDAEREDFYALVDCLPDATRRRVSDWPQPVI